MEYPYIDGGNGWLYIDEELIVVNEDVEMRWHSSNKKYYEGLGYIFTKMRDVFYVNIQNLSQGSNARVIRICPDCRENRNVRFQDLIIAGHSKCQGCSEFKDLTGEKHSECVALEFLYMDKKGNAMYKWRCHCGELFHALGSCLKSGHTTSCGCYRIYMITNHDLTDIDRERERNTPEDRYWKQEIKQLDDFTCQCCGDHQGNNLESHHLNKYSHYPEQRTDLNNGVTLCKTCHKDFHRWMGGTRVECDREDFIQFCEEFYPNAPFSTKL